jgi:hypothetical protein
MPSKVPLPIFPLVSPGDSRCHQIWKWRPFLFFCFLLANGLIVWLGRKPGEYDGLLYSSQGSDEGDTTTMLANYIRKASHGTVEIDSRKGWQHQFQAALWARLLTKAIRHSNSSWSCHWPGCLRRLESKESYHGPQACTPASSADSNQLEALCISGMRRHLDLEDKSRHALPSSLKHKATGW